MSTLLCVPIMVKDRASALAQAEKAQGLGADLVEYRIDEVYAGEGDAEGEQLAMALGSESPLPCIMTCRAAAEGGAYDGDDAARIALYERLGLASGPGEHPPRYIDVEHATYVRSENLRRKVNLAVDHPDQRRDLRTSLILSAHDFSGRPADLTRRVLAMQHEPAAAVLKIAYRARSLRDNLELFDLIRGADRPMIALGMGEFGLMSRVLAPKFGGFLTFGAIEAQSVTAPGQPTVRELIDLYRFRAIGRSTKVYGVVGWPVAHSRSPLVHNAGFEAVGHDGVYLPLPVAAGAENAGGYESFKATVGELVDHPGLDFYGCSVTLPHKENLVRFARERGWALDEASLACGAANTLALTRDGGAVASARVLNTDGAAVVDALAGALGGGDRLAGVPVAVVGAGGVARAAAFGLASRGAVVTVFNRTLARADRLAGEIAQATGRDVASAAAGDLAGADCLVFINCTSVGMSGGPDPAGSSVPVAALAARGAGPETIAFDTVYAPPVTPFLSEARAVGWRTVDGIDMFVRQAARQFEAWTGRAAPVGLFERLLRE